MDKNKHKLYMAQILSLIFKDKDLCNSNRAMADKVMVLRRKLLFFTQTSVCFTSTQCMYKKAIRLCWRMAG